MNPVKLGLFILAVVILGGIVLKMVVGLTFALLNLLVPVAIVAAIVLIIYGLVTGKALGSGRGRLP